MPYRERKKNTGALEKEVCIARRIPSLLCLDTKILNEQTYKLITLSSLAYIDDNTMQTTSLVVKVASSARKAMLPLGTLASRDSLYCPRRSISSSDGSIIVMNTIRS